MIKDKDTKSALRFLMIALGLLVSITYWIYGDWVSIRQQIVHISSLEGLQRFFVEEDISLEAWRKDASQISPIMISSIPKGWGETVAPELPVARKKEIFIQLALPLVMLANQELQRDRTFLMEIGNTDKQTSKQKDWIERQLVKYKIPDQKDLIHAVQTLKSHIDQIPNSLALAQMIEESGWGTSRFAVEGNALYGQWTYGEGLVPKEQREEKGDHRIKVFDSPLQSVKAYMLNMNRNPAYRTFRQARSQMRAQGQTLDGKLLVPYLSSYSERGEAYIQTLRDIIRHNRLAGFDTASLADQTPIKLTF